MSRYFGLFKNGKKFSLNTLAHLLSIFHTWQKKQKLIYYYFNEGEVSSQLEVIYRWEWNAERF